MSQIIERLRSFQPSSQEFIWINRVPLSVIAVSIISAFGLFCYNSKSEKTNELIFKVLYSGSQIKSIGDFNSYFKVVACDTFKPAEFRNSGKSQVEDSLGIACFNKKFVYDEMVKGREAKIGDEIPVSKYECIQPTEIAKQPIFKASVQSITIHPGFFAYDASTEEIMHWTANFADHRIFGYAYGSLFAQDEQQVAEHPALYDFRDCFNGTTLMELDKNKYQATFLQNVSRLGCIDTYTALPVGNFFYQLFFRKFLNLAPKSLYGNYFSQASEAEIKSKLTLIDPPVLSHLFAIVAPGHGGSWYKKEQIQQLFFRFLTACHGIKKISDNKKVVIHTGNWGIGAFGNNPKLVYLITLAVAHFAGIDELRLYPLNHQKSVEEAHQLLNQIRQQYPAMQVGDFLDHLVSHVKDYGFCWGRGNGT